MKATGRTTKQTVREDLSTQMETCTTATGKMIRHTALEFIVI